MTNKIKLLIDKTWDEQIIKTKELLQCLTCQMAIGTNTRILKACDINHSNSRAFCSLERSKKLVYNAEETLMPAHGSPSQAYRGQGL